MNHTFPKKEHLKRKKIIDELFTQGMSIKAFPIRLIYIQTSLPEDQVSIQAGFSVPKRNHKLAVTRNKIKRLLREAYRLNKHTFNNKEQSYAFMFIYMGKEVFTYEQLNKAMIKIAKNFNQKEGL